MQHAGHVRKTALVTGASSGIGAALARQLAAHGHDLILTARSQPRLELLARELAARHGAAAHIIAADLAEPGSVELILHQVAATGSRLDVLVNSAGFGSCGELLDMPLESELAMVRVNCESVVALCHEIGRELRERRSGRILNIASLAGFQPGPYMATYFASKAFVISFSLALAHELADSGVSVTCHCPGPVDTAFADRAGNRETKLFRGKVATAEDVAADAYRAMMAGKRLAVHGALNRAAAAGARWLPVNLVTAIAAGLNRRTPSSGA